ncbi:MAG: di-trans,poly-cis-decaprenylcistransferase [Candidatus Wildermuthbacteria bacterium]|nr:di-trans,poly-cis-decaprenylcistransferase [Candidatus Wildermuthbacteria bacterium]
MNEIIPKHIVFFLDGNRRWAKEQGLPSLEGHRAGYENVLRLCEWAKARGVNVLTAYGFSTENWGRSRQEVNYLMTLFEKGLSDKNNMEKFQKDGVRVRIIGQKERLPSSLQKIIQDVETATQKQDQLFLNLAISYGGRWDIVQAVKKMMSQGLAAEQIDESTFPAFLSTAGLPEPDLVIRAGGEKRFSNFLLWQSAYAELYFSPKYWPDFTEEDFNQALEEFSQRKRRFGH